MTTVPTQARHGPGDTGVNGVEAMSGLLAVAAKPDRIALTPRELQVWPKSTSITTGRGGSQRQALIVRCRCGHEHQHYAPLGVPFVIRSAPCRLRYAIHLAFP